MDILFLSHCIPNPPNKGEKIRASQEIKALCQRHRVHLVCFARDERELDDANALRTCCASVYAELLPFRRTLARAAVRFAFGGCLNMAFYESGKVRKYVSDLSRDVALSAVVIYALPMAPYAPSSIPALFDMQDVDSEKWLQYGRMKRFGFLYRAEAHRIRKHELAYARTAACTFLTARQEAQLFRELAPFAVVECMENGVDLDFFDPAKVPVLPELSSRRFISFVGTMDYYPNQDAAIWFARQALPELRRRAPDVEFFVVGNNPGSRVRMLARLPGVTVTGGVPDVRPYITQARAVVAPLRLARGIQNKVLEAMMLGRRVFATTGVARTFGDDVPIALTCCDSVQEFAAAITPELEKKPASDCRIRDEIRPRFTWKKNVTLFVSRLEEMMRTPAMQET
jgi:sugar transferase (PEP-CTERM/EpsH1 system associated)